MTHYLHFLLKVGPGKAFPAISLISYDPKYKRVMEWLFGEIFICVDNETASKISFDRSLKRKSVTLDGDVYDPSGVVAGGKFSYLQWKVFDDVLRSNWTL